MLECTSVKNTSIIKAHACLQNFGIKESDIPFARCKLCMPNLRRRQLLPKDPKAHPPNPRHVGLPKKTSPSLKGSHMPFTPTSDLKNLKEATVPKLPLIGRRMHKNEARRKRGRHYRRPRHRRHPGHRRHPARHRPRNRHRKSHSRYSAVPRRHHHHLRRRSVSIFKDWDTVPVSKIVKDLLPRISYQPRDDYGGLPKSLSKKWIQKEDRLLQEGTMKIKERQDRHLLMKTDGPRLKDKESISLSKRDMPAAMEDMDGMNETMDGKGVKIVPPVPDPAPTCGDGEDYPGYDDGDDDDDDGDDDEGGDDDYPGYDDGDDDDYPGYDDGDDGDDEDFPGYDDGDDDDGGEDNGDDEDFP
ncbi:hypothetical protein M422DRAFT_777732, partial [Sphaerobolus stellatus SS14]